MRILFFDGYCSLCNGLVDQLMKLDRKQQLKFASLQGQTAKDLLQHLDAAHLDTVIYFRDGQRLERSVAILTVLSDLGGLWQLVGILKIIPSSLRDVLYKWIAKNRYKVFGKRETCRLPSPEEQARLLP